MDIVPTAANSPPLRQWPARVAVIAYGLDTSYSKIPAIMWDRMKNNSFMPVASPLELRRWAQTNQARIPNSRVVVSLNIIIW